MAVKGETIPCSWGGAMALKTSGNLYIRWHKVADLYDLNFTMVRFPGATLRSCGVSRTA
jgi:hypothetical protein